MVMESRLGQMARSTKANGAKVRCMAKENYSSVTVKALQVSSRVVCLGDWEFDNGLMATTTRASMSRATSKVQDYSSAKSRDGSMMVYGKQGR